jgi:hypothetical protein
MTNEELIEEMRDAWMNYRLSLEYGQTVITADGMKKVLSVVKSHIGSVAEYCSCVRDDARDDIYDHISNCEKCNGSGVIARGDK